MKLSKRGSPFGRMGGKSRIAKKLIEQFPRDIGIYVEPFFGVGNVFYRMKDVLNPKETHLNDLDKDMYDVMIGLRDEDINGTIPRDSISRQDWILLRDNPNKTKTELILMYIYSFFCQGKAYNPKFEKMTNRKISHDFDVFKQKLEGATITNLSFEKVIDEYRNREDGFIYLDPPYEVCKKRKDYYNHTSVSPEDVLEALKPVKCKWMLSYNNSEYIKNLYRDYFIYELNTKYSQTKNIGQREKKEIVITNYKIDEWGDGK